MNTSKMNAVVNNILRRRLLAHHPRPSVVLNKISAARPLSYYSGPSSSSNNNITFERKVSNRSHIELTNKRWRHSGKRGNHLQTLDELAHRPEREAAEERRKKKKERKAAKKKGGKKGAAAETESEPVASAAEAAILSGLDEDDDLFDDDDDDDFDFEDESVGEGDEDSEPTLPDTDLVKEKMEKVIAKFEESLKSIRGAEPTADMFDDIQVSAYGSMTPLKAVGQVVIVSPTLGLITCFDPAVAKDVCKAIQLALGLNPQVEEGGNVKVPLPRVSMEVREQTAKALNKKTESCKQRLRKVRRKAMDLVKKGKDGKLVGISKDDAFATGKEVEAVTEASMSMLQEVVDRKMESIMAV